MERKNNEYIQYTILSVRAASYLMNNPNIKRTLGKNLTFPKGQKV